MLNSKGENTSEPTDILLQFLISGLSSLHEDWTCSKLYDFQSGLSPQEQSSR